MMSVADSIKILREKSLLTQEAFAKEIGVSSATINRWENSKVRPNMTAMKAIKSFCETHNYPYEEIESGWLYHSSEEQLSRDKGISNRKHRNGGRNND